MSVCNSYHSSSCNFLSRSALYLVLFQPLTDPERGIPIAQMLILDPNASTKEFSELRHNLNATQDMAKPLVRQPLSHLRSSRLDGFTSRSVATGPIERSWPMKNSRSKSLAVKPTATQNSSSQTVRASERAAERQSLCHPLVPLLAPLAFGLLTKRLVP